MTVDNDFKWKKPGLTSMQEKKTWIFSMIVVVKKERKKLTHIKNNQTKLWSVFSLFVVKKPHQSYKRYCGGDIWTQLLGLKSEVSAKVP